jgi:hypothetical protein
MRRRHPSKGTSMTNPRWKLKRLRWWNLPIPLYRRDDEGWTKIGWIWNQTAYIVNNIHHGWVAFVDDQTEERLKYIDVWSCQCCGAELSYDKKKNIEKYLGDKE